MGNAAALVLRLILLVAVAFIVKLTKPVIEFWDISLSWRDIILIAGGLFLVWKATREIHHIVDPAPAPTINRVPANQMVFSAAIVQIQLLGLVFSIDSIIAAVGMTPHVPIMLIAVVVAVLAMLLAADLPGGFHQQEPNDRYACPWIPATHRVHAHRGWNWCPCSAR